MQNEVVENQQHDLPGRFLDNQQSQSPDWFLQQLVKYANDADFTLTVTLFVKGSIISGTIVSGAKFFDGLGEKVEQALIGKFDDDIAEKIGTTFKNCGQVYSECKEYTTEAAKAAEEEKGLENAQETFDPLPLEGIAYIHLANVRMITPEGRHMIFHPPSAVWRGRISSVDGFMCGSSIPEER